MTKDEARSVMKKLRREMSDAERACQNEDIRRQILADPVWNEISWFYPFVSYGTEVDTLELIRELLEKETTGTEPNHRKIHVAVPRVAGRDMDFYEIHAMEDLKPGYHGILEPAEHCPKVEAAEGLMLLPGLAFDREGHRVGYGGGYYDRYLARYQSPSLHLYAVAYDFQIVDHIEAQEHDIPPHRIITSQNKHN